MFNSATVFDEGFCLDCESHGGTSVADSAYKRYLREKVGLHNKCRRIFGEELKAPEQAPLCLRHVLLRDKRPLNGGIMRSYRRAG